MPRLFSGPFFSGIAILGYNAISRSVVNTGIANGRIIATGEKVQHLD